jgi:hypothetical protein
MILDIIENSKENKCSTVTELYEYIKNNINNILKDEDIKTMLSPETNSATRRLLEDNSEEDAYILSYLTTTIILFQVYGINLED